MSLQSASITTTSGVVVSSHARMATSFASRLMGLLNREALGPSEALLLVPGGSIHTLGMRFPIDVLFLSVTAHILAMKVNVQPWRASIAPRGTKLVLELAAGRTQALNLEPGMQLLLHQQPQH